MGHYIRDLSELQESREILESKSHSFIAVFISLLTFALLSLLIWSYFGEMDVVTKANGEIRPNETVSTIQAPVSGQVEAIHYAQGQKIQKGDILLVLKKEDIEVELTSVQKELEREQEELKNLQLLKESIEKNTNLFSKETPSHTAYYEAFQQYQVDVSQFQLESKNASSQLEREKLSIEEMKQANKTEMEMYVKSEEEVQKQKKRFTDEVNQIQETINQLTLLKESYLNEKNLLSKGEYDTLFKSYEKQLTSLEDETIQRQNEYEQLVSLEEDQISEGQLEQAKQKYEEAVSMYDSYKNQQIAAVEEQLSMENNRLQEMKLQLSQIQQTNVLDVQKEDYQKSQELLNQEISTIKEEINTNQQLKETALSKFKLDKINEINAAIKQKEKDVSLMEDERKAINVQLDHRNITAPIDGVINIQTPVNVGDMLSPETVLVTIIPDQTSEYKVELYIHNSDISKIKVGDEIKYHLSALPYKEYGELKGKITNISSDTVTNEADGLDYYLVEASIQNKALSSYKGKKTEITIGMQTKAYVVTDQKKLLHAALEKLNFKN